MYDILIVGSGPAGFTAAIYAKRANKKIAMITGFEKGGQLTKTTLVENFPGFADGVLGPQLMENMELQAKNLDIEFIEDELVDFEKINEIFHIKTHFHELQTKALIIATGAKAKLLNIEKHLLGSGISTCATCDGAFFKNKTVAVIGGGNTAFEEAIYLANMAKKVYLIHRRNEFRAEKIMQKRIEKKENIELLTPFIIKEFIGIKILEKAILENLETKQTHELNLDGAFIAIGHEPNTKFLENKIELDNQGYVKNGLHTEIPGLFVAGDVYDQQYRQAITAAGMGCMAAIDALHWLEQN